MDNAPEPSNWPRPGRERKQTSRSTFYFDLLHVERSILCFPGLNYASDGILTNTGERKLKNQKLFCAVIGLDGRCSVQAEQSKIRVAFGPMPGWLPVDRNKLDSDSCCIEKFFLGHTHRIKVPWTAMSTATHVTPSKNKSP